jgi:hypothetical protein
MLAAAGAMAWLAQLGPHTGYAAGVLGPLILVAIGLGLVIAPADQQGAPSPAHGEVSTTQATAGPRPSA